MTPNEIDEVVTNFRKTNPDFCNGYFAARVIVSRVAMRAAAATLKVWRLSRSRAHRCLGSVSAIATRFAATAVKVTHQFRARRKKCSPFIMNFCLILVRRLRHATFLTREFGHRIDIS
jgi:hypothetical protein